jgi:pimeloyl-ACP methyl ester carboxylesterase
VTRLVILPGTDGTGALLGEFLAALGDLNSLVLSYPTDRCLGYEQLAEFIHPQLPAEPYFLLGESFGGPLAVLLASAEGSLCAGIILCASFARAPVWLLRAFAPLTALLPVRRMPPRVMSWFLLGPWSTPNLRAQLAGALALVSPSVVRARLRAALQVNVSRQLNALGVPLLYLQASHDRIIPASVGRGIIASVPHATLVRVTGPHFLLQVAPQACAAEVRRFVGC